MQEPKERLFLKIWKQVWTEFLLVEMCVMFMIQLIFVTGESQKAGKAAAKYISENSSSEFRKIEILNGEGIFYTVPQNIRVENIENRLEIFFRVKSVEKNIVISVTDENGNIIKEFKTIKNRKTFFSSSCKSLNSSFSFLQ